MTVPPCSELLQVGARFPHGMLPGTERPPTDGSAAVVAVAALAQARLQFGHPRLGRPAGGGFVAQARLQLFTGVERPPRDRVVEAELAGVQVQLQPQHRAAYRQQPALLLLRRQRLVSAATQLRALQRRSRQSPVGSYCQYSPHPEATVQLPLRHLVLAPCAARGDLKHEVRPLPFFPQPIRPAPVIRHPLHHENVRGHNRTRICPLRNRAAGSRTRIRPAAPAHRPRTARNTSAARRLAVIGLPYRARSAPLRLLRGIIERWAGNHQRRQATSNALRGCLVSGPDEFRSVAPAARSCRLPVCSPTLVPHGDDRHAA